MYMCIVIDIPIAFSTFGQSSSLKKVSPIIVILLPTYTLK